MTDLHTNSTTFQERWLTPGVTVLLFFVLIGAVFGAIRMIFGIGAVANLSNQYPWGIWIGVDVASGEALSAGGFTTAALVYVLQRRLFHSVVRPALLTALLGYTFAALALAIDIGRWWNIWSPLVHWNVNSILFVVAICVVFYLAVLCLEFAPVVVKRFQGKVRLPGSFSRMNLFAEALLDIAEACLGKIMPVLIISGIVLSFLHQSWLGALMLIAPSKVHPLWYTPILPLLFLLSAVAVGFPMVVFESIAAERAFGHQTDRRVLAGLANFMPFLIGLYLAFKIGDLAFRGAWVHLFDAGLQAKAFWVELLIGAVLPFVMLLFPRIRQSKGWLFWASTLFVAGVLLNRVNVFWVGFQPLYQGSGYFPAVGELAITAGFVAALILAYRIAVTIFPVFETRGHKHLSLLAMLLLPLLWVAPSDAQEKSEKDSGTATVLIEKAATLIVLDSPVIKSLGDRYEPVKFMHRRHAILVGDCTVCHHRTPREPGDDYGSPITLVELERSGRFPVACSKCHAQPWQEKQLHKPGLKGALHQKCLGCHQAWGQKPDSAFPGASAWGPRVLALSPAAKAPLDCRSCHAPHVPSHQELVRLGPGAGPEEVTAACRSCHAKQAEENLRSSHWLWQGPSTNTAGSEKRDDLGKGTWAMDNSWISAAANLQSCTRCHVGYGWKDAGFDFRNPNNVDCLACHDTTGKYKKQDSGGLPVKGVDLAEIGKRVGRPGRQTCGMKCHFSGGKDDLLAHGGLSPALLLPDRRTDVHMASEGANLLCQDCHRTRDHRISGGGLDAIPSEGSISCSGCHSDRPHPKKGSLNSHLNRHTEHLACQTCHIPAYSKSSFLPVRWDWSGGSSGNSLKTADLGPWGAKIGFASGVTPEYRWFSGKVQRVFPGDRVASNPPVELNAPQGERKDPGSEIFPFWTRSASQPLDKTFRALLIPRWPSSPKEAPQWEAALSQGMSALNLPYSGAFEFVETVTYHGINHEVPPKQEALSCRDCHSVLAEAPFCGRCHQQTPGWDFEALASGGSPAQASTRERGRTRLDFKALGYAGDPVLIGGRFTRLPLAVPQKIPLPEKTGKQEEADGKQ